MKFAKELEQDAVPEWRVKYLNYKAGKKHIKAVTRAIYRANGTPNLGRIAEPPHGTPSSFLALSRTFTKTRSAESSKPASGDDLDSLRASPAPIGWAPFKPAGGGVVGGERAGLSRSPGSSMQYGSVVTPASRASARTDFELPAPAMKVPSRTGGQSAAPSPAPDRLALHRSASMANVPSRSQIPSPLNLPPSRAAGTPTETSKGTPRHRMARLFSSGSPLARHTSSKGDIGMTNLDTVRAAEREFYSFLDAELDKIETFYKMKEDQATQRLALLREQLHEMRNRRTEEIAEAKRQKELERDNSRSRDDLGEGSKDTGRDWMSPLKARLLKPGPNSKALQRMAQTPVMAHQNTDAGRDYVRRPHTDDVPYRTAKRKLKLALQEFYRGLELLKSYALLNRTAFRKLNKKYDKAVKARPTYRYMNEKVNKSWFVNSDVLDGHIHTVEDLYARYFERGNHKIANGKLRNLNRRPGDASANTFRGGLLIGCGGVFAVQGLIYGSELLFDVDLVLKERTGYLMQIYGGYFLMLLLFTLFTLACRVWTNNKVNYPFIFEFDTRNNLDWKQLAEFPSFFFALFGIIIWLNFSRFGNWEVMYLYYPVILIFITIVILFFPAPIFHHKARRWFLYSHNVELFFCLYATYWAQPDQCNSNHSRLMGFFGALPPIWRALQCIRRYHDTGNVFPHLVNCGKYTMTILAAICLSLYRIDGTRMTLSFFLTFATINAIYCSIWDIFMDFSLLQSNSKHWLLRDIIALKSVWAYYAIMVVDPVLRFSWIFYAIFTHNTQHSTVVSFFVAFAEVMRRGMWTVIRVENEHCGNVAQYKASRDTPLPYHLEEPETERSSLEVSGGAGPADGRESRTSATTTGAQVPGSGRTVPIATAKPTATAEGPLAEEAAGGPSSTFRRRRSDTMGKKSILRVMAEAHKQDFEKKRLPLPGDSKTATTAAEEEDEEDDELHSEDEDEDDETGSIQEERMQVREAETLMKRGRGDEGEESD
ncbi:SPX domain-containing protein [Cercophora scortea]|uniref:SPX domain-containing protein n=1 Tax=Cercophora scortea TaxID=314031 RepID=A0AAE0IMB5_9PEZI|nr:SPX domain-containing protein [Cercophora scortea]